MSDESYQALQPQPPSLPMTPSIEAIRCPGCGSAQFFGGRKTTGWGWFWLISAILNFIISIPLMFILVGFFTIFLSPLMGIGFHLCKKHVNTCARCKREF